MRKITRHKNYAIRMSVALGAMGIFFLAPLFAFAKPLTVAVWIPYWKKDAGIAEVAAHIATVQEISPFSYEVRADGTLIDKLKINQDPWQGFFATTTAKKIAVVPSIAWTDSDAILAILSSSSLRQAHIAAIADLVSANNFAGIDIDYENKKVATRPYFSKFIKELAAILHKDKKILSCSVEARTPLASRFAVIPRNIQYANDFAVLNTSCDEIRLLAYDQGNIDIVLNKRKGGAQLYAPIADRDWVEKIIKEAIKSIRPSKIMLGIPTFGYEYAVAPRAARGFDYQKLHSVSYQDALDLAKIASTTATRNSAGEVSFSYQQATSTHLVWFPDGNAAGAKMKLARVYKLRGVALFKADGESDPHLWDIILSHR